MASLVLCMQLRTLFHDIKQQLAKHRKVIRIRKAVKRRYYQFCAGCLGLSSKNFSEFVMLELQTIDHSSTKLQFNLVYNNV